MHQEQHQEGLETRPSGYYTPDGINYNLFQLSHTPTPPHLRELALRQLNTYLNTKKESFLGYQVGQKMDFQRFSAYLNMSPNNIGNSFSTGQESVNPRDGFFRLNTKWIERAVLDYFARLWHAKSPHLSSEDKDPDWKETYWGYVLSMGATEGNLYGVRNGRDYLSGIKLQYDQEAADIFLSNKNHDPNEAALRYLSYHKAEEPHNPAHLTPVLIYSSTTHYSVQKISKILMIKTFQEVGEELKEPCPITGDTKWVKTIPTNEDGTMNLEALKKVVQFFSSRKYPVLVNFNYGTTWTGGLDDVGAAVAELRPILEKNGMWERELKWRSNGKEETEIRNGFWFHVDGALGAGYVPFVQDQKELAGTFPMFDFRLPIHSITASGHKWMGMPWPCGIYLTKNKFLTTADTPAYVSSLDLTLAGSRNALTPILMWDYLSQTSFKEQQDEVMDALDLAETTKQLLEEAGRRPYRAKGSLAVVFDKPNDINIIKRFSMPVVQDKAHILIMKHVTPRLIYRLLEALKNDDNNKITNTECNYSQGW